jgi:hypothetical protein
MLQPPELWRIGRRLVTVTLICMVAMSAVALLIDKTAPEGPALACMQCTVDSE